jgi:hypothetical protein
MGASMADRDATLTIDTGSGEQHVALSSCLDAQSAERAEREANAWIKSLRHVEVDGRALRDRFVFRGDSLWWFAELYLHKRRVVNTILRTLEALEALAERERPLALGVAGGDDMVIHVARQFAEGRRLAWRGAPQAALARWRHRLEPAWRGAFYSTAAVADRLRPGHRPPCSPGAVRVAAFVHSAFWREATDEESYLGPVLRELSDVLGPGRLHLVGLGPRTNFRSRTWRQRLAEFRDPQASRLPFAPVETYASRTALAPAAAVWRDRRAIRRALLSSEALRASCVFRGCDAWPLLRDEFTGISHLQFPWSARAMAEAGAALDALRPRAVLTYAEAGGWGRALALEARRRGIPLVGLQHGFIYRHWLNYLHEADEMAPSPANPADRGFPRPHLTLVYDLFAAHHLLEAGHFPPDSVAVSGSPKLDAFLETARSMDDAARASVRASVGVEPGQHLVVVATKYTQIARDFGALIRAAAEMPDVRLVVKCHPAETPEAYDRAARAGASVTIAPATADLARLVASSSLVVTVNSTAAIEAMPLDVPALVVSLPNNLTPFVEAGAVAGAASAAEIGPALRALLYDEQFRARLARGRRAFMERYQIAPDGRAAARAAAAIARLASA